jgi:hypothetical protein
MAENLTHAEHLHEEPDLRRWTTERQKRKAKQGYDRALRARRVKLSLPAPMTGK